MIPKKLHYIWVGNEKPINVLHCIDSFHKLMSDYEIIEWNESNIDCSLYNDSLLHLYENSYKNGMFAFCSDIARLYILKLYGGIYVDADVEFIQHLPDKFLEDCFISRINPVNTVCSGCIWGCTKDDSLVSNMIDLYAQKSKEFFDTHGRKWIFNTILKDYFRNMGDTIDNTKVCDICNYKVYPTEYFCPQNYRTGKIDITSNTISIHHFNFSWKANRIKQRCRHATNEN